MYVWEENAGGDQEIRWLEDDKDASHALFSRTALSPQGNPRLEDASAQLQQILMKCSIYI